MCKRQTKQVPQWDDVSEFIQDALVHGEKCVVEENNKIYASYQQVNGHFVTVYYKYVEGDLRICNAYVATFS